MNEHRNEYRRDVGTIGVAFLIINGMVGAGIFALPELLHRAVGNFAPWLILAGAFLIASVAICFAALASLTDRSGGPERFVTDALGRFPGFQIGWLFYFGRMLSQAANVTVLTAYAAAFWPALRDGIWQKSAVLVIVAAVTVLNVVGIRRAVAVLSVMTLFKLLPLIMLIAVALAIGPGFRPVNLPQFSTIEGVALSALYAFTGFENATITAGETKEPKRAMPRALLSSLGIVTLIYFGLQYVYSNSPIAGHGSEAPLASLAGYYAGDAGSLLIAGTVIISVLANMTAGHTTASRMTAALADDELLPDWFGQVSRWGTPANSIAFFGLGALLFALSGTFATLAVSGTLARLIVYMASICSLPLLRKLSGLTPINGVIGMAAPIGFALTFWATLQSTWEQWALIAGFVSAGTLLFFVAPRSKI